MIISLISRFQKHYDSPSILCRRTLSLRRLSGIGMIAILWTLLPLVVQAQQALELTTVSRPLDTLTFSGGPFSSDRSKICVRFSGDNECSMPTSVSSNLRELQVAIPAGAVSGPVTVQVGTTTVGTAQLQIDRSDTVQTALKDLVDSITGNLLAYMAALAGLGVLSMSIVQAIKTLLPIPQFLSMASNAMVAP